MLVGVGKRTLSATRALSGRLLAPVAVALACGITVLTPGQSWVGPGALALPCRPTVPLAHEAGERTVPVGSSSLTGHEGRHVPLATVAPPRPSAYILAVA